MELLKSEDNILGGTYIFNLCQKREKVVFELEKKNQQNKTLKNQNTKPKNPKNKSFLFISYFSK